MLYKKEFKNWLDETFNGEYTFDGEIKNQKSKVIMTHNKCGYSYTVQVGTFYSMGRRCSNCAGNLKWNTEKYKNYVKQITNDEYDVIGKYTNNNTPIKMIHNKCGYEFNMRPANFKNGNRCPKCAGLKKHTIEEIKNSIFEIVGNEYELLSKEYINNKTPLLFHHNKCGHDFQMASKDFLKKNGNRCPNCKRSKGELEIEKILNKYNLKFESNYRNSGCKNKRNLQFDFKVFLPNSKFCFIEFDGRFHYEPWKNNKKEIKHLQDQKNNDEIKNKFCEDNNIKLIRISYKDFNQLENILIEKLNIDVK